MNALLDATLPLVVLLGCAAIADRLVARASTRRLLWALAATAGVVLPGLIWLLPAAAPGAPALIGAAAGTSGTVAAAIPLPAAFAWRPILLAGVGGGVAQLALGLTLARRLARATRPVARPLPTGISVAVREGPGVRTPMTVGLLRPVVLVPTSAAAWPEARWAAVIRHEAAHAQGRDPALLVFAGLARALGWFNPLSWYAVSRLRVAVESAADDAVLESGIAGADYARCLLDVARAGSPGLLGTAAGFGRRRGLEPRIRSVLASRRRGPVGRRRAVAATAVAAVLLAFAALATPRFASADSGPKAIHLHVGQTYTHDYGPMRAMGVSWPGAVRVDAGTGWVVKVTALRKGHATLYLYRVHGGRLAIPIVID